MIIPLTCRVCFQDSKQVIATEAVTHRLTTLPEEKFLFNFPLPASKKYRGPELKYWYNSLEIFRTFFQIGRACAAIIHERTFPRLIEGQGLRLHRAGIHCYNIWAREMYVLQILRWTRMTHSQPRWRLPTCKEENNEHISLFFPSTGAFLSSTRRIFFARNRTEVWMSSAQSINGISRSRCSFVLKLMKWIELRWVKTSLRRWQSPNIYILLTSLDLDSIECPTVAVHLSNFAVLLPDALFLLIFPPPKKS